MGGIWNLIVVFFTEFIPAIWLAATHEIPDTVNYLRNQIGPHARHYWHIFLWLAVLAIATPLILVALDLIFKAGWLTAMAGLALALFLAVLLIRPIYFGLAVLLGVVWSLLHFQIKGTVDTGIKWAKSYISVITAFLLWELLIVFYLSIFPVWNNPRALPIVTLCALVLALMIYVWGFKGAWFRRLAYVFVIFVLIFETFSFVFPKTSGAMNDKRPKLDEKMAKWVESPTWPEKKAKEPPAPRYVPPTERYPRLIETEPWEIEIRPDRLSKPYQRLEGGGVCFDTGALKARDIGVYDAISENYLGRFSEVKFQWLKKGVKFKGPCGVIRKTG